MPRYAKIQFAKTCFFVSSCGGYSYSVCWGQSTRSGWVNASVFSLLAKLKAVIPLYIQYTVCTLYSKSGKNTHRLWNLRACIVWRMFTNPNIPSFRSIPIVLSVKLQFGLRFVSCIFTGSVVDGILYSDQYAEYGPGSRSFFSFSSIFDSPHLKVYFFSFSGTNAAKTDFRCPEEFGYYAHPTDCSLYYGEYTLKVFRN